MRVRIAGVVGAVVLCAAVAAVAGSKQTSMRVELLAPATLNGKEIPAGSYKVAWTGDGSDVKVTFLAGKKVVGETTGKFIERTSKAREDGLVSVNNGGGRPAISEIRFAGESRALSLSGS
jgi:hypothetical protein